MVAPACTGNGGASSTICSPSPERTYSTSSASGWLCRSWPLPGRSTTSPSVSPAPSSDSGETSHLIEPHSNVCVGSEFGSTAGTDVPFHANGLEAPHVLGHRRLGREPLHAGGTEEADDALGALEHVRRVLGLGDGPAVAEHEHV